MTTENILLDLVKEFEKAQGFSPLSRAEEQLLTNVGKGNTTNFSDKKAFLTRKKHEPDSTLMKDRTIRAELLRWLILDEKAKSNVSPYGIRIQSAYIKGVLNLDSARIPFPLIFQNCYIKETIDLRDAQTLLLSFNSSHTGPIRASRIIVESSLALNNGFWAKGEVRLHSAHIKGQLDCRKGRFYNSGQDGCDLPEENRYALMANGIKVNGDVYLTEILAHGPVSLTGANIVNNLECHGGRFLNRSFLKNWKRKALEADRIQVGGHVYLTSLDTDEGRKSRALIAVGQVSLVQAHIKGSLICRSALFCRKGQIALDVRETQIAGSARFEGIKSNGLVRLTGSAVDGCMHFVDVIFYGDQKSGLTGKSLDVKGTFAWTAIG